MRTHKQGDAEEEQVIFVKNLARGFHVIRTRKSSSFNFFMKENSGNNPFCVDLNA